MLLIAYFDLCKISCQTHGCLLPTAVWMGEPA